MKTSTRWTWDDTPMITDAGLQAIDADPCPACDNDAFAEELCPVCEAAKQRRMRVASAIRRVWPPRPISQTAISIAQGILDDKKLH